MSAESFERLLDHLRRAYCPGCQLSLFCMAGPAKGSFWCRQCNGYWVPALRYVVRCTGFPAARPRYVWKNANADSYSFVRGWRQDHSEHHCPHCSPHRFTAFTPGELAAMLLRPRVIEGFLAEDTSISDPVQGYRRDPPQK